MIIGLLGLVMGCLGPVPGIIAIILGWMALSQMKKNPLTASGKPMAIIGVVTGSLTFVFYSLFILWIILGAIFGNL
jgi:predicted acyltransferase